MEWQRAFDRLNFHTLHEDGFSIRSHNPQEGIVVRYSEGERELTLLASLEDETEKQGRRWLLFRRFAVILRVPSELRWDNGEPMSQPEALMALDRIRVAISKDSPYRLMIDDEFYAALQRDVNTR